MKCSNSECQTEAAVHVLVELHAPEPATGKAIGATTLVLCPAHRDAATVSEVMPDESWEQLCKAWEDAGRCRPDRTLTRLVFEPIS